MSIAESIIKTAAQLSEQGATAEDIKFFMQVAVATAMEDTTKLGALLQESLNPEEKAAGAFVDSVIEIHNQAIPILHKVFRANADPLTHIFDETNETCKGVFKRTCGIMKDLVQTGWINPKSGQHDNIANAALASWDPANVDTAMHLMAFWSSTPEKIEEGFRKALDLVDLGSKLAESPTIQP